MIFVAVYRVNKNRGYTVMANFHLRDKSLSLKAVGLLSKMLSFNDGWKFSTKGLSAICKEGPDAILSALRELETHGYLVRHRQRDGKGRMSSTIFEIYEEPQESAPEREMPHTENPCVEKPDVEKPDVDNPHGDTCNCKEKCAAGQVNTDCPVCKTNMSECTGTAPATPEPDKDAETDAPAPKPEKKSNVGMILVIFALAGAAGAAYYYIKFVKGRKPKDEDMDFFDDEGYEEEPYINEDDEPQIAEDAETDGDED